jgi:hypothetical protein
LQEVYPPTTAESRRSTTQSGAPLASCASLDSSSAQTVAQDPQKHTFDAGKHRKNSLAAWLPDLLGRAAQSSPEAAPRRAKGAGLYGDGADRATLQPPPLTLKSSSRFPDAPTHAQRNGQHVGGAIGPSFRQ